MTSIRRLLALFPTIALVAFALPTSAAPTKIFGLVMSPANVSTSPVQLTATFSNLTPNGNSVVNTVILTPPTSAPTLTVNSVSFPNGGSQIACPATTVNSSGQTVPVPAGSICVANIPSVMKAGCTPTACSWAMKVTVALPNTCAVYNWSGQAFTGNAFNGDVFSFVAGNSSVTTTIGSGCVYNINTSAVPPAGGSVSCVPPSVTSGGGSTCTATANANYTFSAFSGSCSGATCVLTNVTSTQNVTATFTANTLTISGASSAVVGKDFFLTVSYSLAGASATLGNTCGATSSVDSSTSTSTKYKVNIATLPVNNPVTNPPTCTFTATASNYFDATPVALPVYKGVLDCNGYDSINGPSDTFYDPDKTTDDFFGNPGWGLRRATTNKDGSTACVKINYSCDYTAPSGTNKAVFTCTWDKHMLKADGTCCEQPVFKYLFVWPGTVAESSGYVAFRPQVSWPPAVADTTSAKAYKFPTWSPLVACLSDTFPPTGSDPKTILPLIPTFTPFSDDADNTLAQYQPGATAFVCGGKYGWTAFGGLIYQYNIIVDEADLVVRGP